MSPKIHASPKPQGGALFGNRVFADVTVKTETLREGCVQVEAETGPKSATLASAGAGERRDRAPGTSNLRQKDPPAGTTGAGEEGGPHGSRGACPPPLCPLSRLQDVRTISGNASARRTGSGPGLLWSLARPPVVTSQASDADLSLPVPLL